MKSLPIPKFNAQEVYQLCVDGVSCSNLKGKLQSISADINARAQLYENKAPQNSLYEILPFKGKGADIVLGTVTKKELCKVYTDYMVGQSAPASARDIYDRLKASVPLDVCPYCGFGHVGTLDHYLSKARYPYFSVLPINLVPSCTDCNFSKKASVAKTAGQQSIHPYFDQKLISEQWLFAEIIETSPASINFVVTPPANWTKIEKQRVKTHFSDFKLNKRYSTEAGRELGNLRDLLQYDYEFGGGIAVKNELVKRYSCSYRQNKNSWKTALYLCLSNSDWYCEGGFR
jgi:hypothetical protein